MKYSKNQILEAIGYWKSLLNERMFFEDEDTGALKNIVIVQGICGNMFAQGRPLEYMQGALATGAIRKNLDFQLFYKLSDDMTGRVITAPLFSTNCPKAAQKFRQYDQTAFEILRGVKPFAAYITDNKDHTITAKELSPHDAQILKQHNAQKPDMKIFRLSFNSRPYCLAVPQAPLYWLENYKAYGGPMMVKNGQVFVQAPGEPVVDGVEAPADGYVDISVDAVKKQPYILGGYVDRIVYNPQIDEFTVEGDRAMFDHNIAKLNNDYNGAFGRPTLSKFFRDSVSELDDIAELADSDLIALIEAAVTDGSNRRTTKPRRAPRRAPKLTTKTVTH